MGALSRAKEKIHGFFVSSSRQSALGIVRLFAFILYFIGAIGLIAAITINRMQYKRAIIGAIICLALGFLLHRFHSRLVAIFFLLVFFYSLILRIIHFEEHDWIDLAGTVTAICFAIRLIEATSKLHGIFRESAASGAEQSFTRD